MSHYRKVDCRIWIDAKFMSLSHNGKLAFLYLLTHPQMTSLGAMRATLSGLADELEMTQKAFQEAFREGCLKGMVEHDEKHHLIALPNFIKYNKPESPNVVIGWRYALEFLPECALKNRVITRANAFISGMSEGFRKAFKEVFGEACRQAMPNQEQEQEQEQEGLKEPPNPRDGLTPAVAAQDKNPLKKHPAQKNVNQGKDPVGVVIEFLNAQTGKRFTTADANAKLIRARMAEGATLDDLKNVIALKTAEWLTDQKMNRYLRPATLFNAEKFNQYVGEVGAAKPKNDQDAINEMFGITNPKNSNVIDVDFTVVRND